MRMFLSRCTLVCMWCLVRQNKTCNGHTRIIGQIGHCTGSNFNIHIWAWSASPSLQVGRLVKQSNSVSLECCHIFTVRDPTCILSNPVN